MSTHNWKIYTFDPKALSQSPPMGYIQYQSVNIETAVSLLGLLWINMCDNFSFWEEVVQKQFLIEKRLKNTNIKAECTHQPDHYLPTKPATTLAQTMNEWSISREIPDIG